MFLFSLSLSKTQLIFNSILSNVHYNKFQSLEFLYFFLISLQNLKFAYSKPPTFSCPLYFLSPMNIFNKSNQILRSTCIIPDDIRILHSPINLCKSAWITFKPTLDL